MTWYIAWEIHYLFPYKCVYVCHGTYNAWAMCYESYPQCPILLTTTDTYVAFYRSLFFLLISYTLYSNLFVITCPCWALFFRGQCIEILHLPLLIELHLPTNTILYYSFADNLGFYFRSVSQSRQLRDRKMVLTSTNEPAHLQNNWLQVVFFHWGMFGNVISKHLFTKYCFAFLVCWEQLQQQSPVS